LLKKGELSSRFSQQKKVALLKQVYLDDISKYLSSPKRVCTSLNEIRKYLLDLHKDDLQSCSLDTIARWVKKARFSRKRVSSGIKERNSLEMTTH